MFLCCCNKPEISNNDTEHDRGGEADVEQQETGDMLIWNMSKSYQFVNQNQLFEQNISDKKQFFVSDLKSFVFIRLPSFWAKS